MTNSKSFLHFRPTGRKVSVEWFKKDYNDVSQPIASSSKYKRLDENRRLEINNPTYKKDHGKFECVTYADNEQKDRRLVHLDVFGKIALQETFWKNFGTSENFGKFLRK